ncbi:MAG: WYL domain-containing protein [Muribaculaceae bacterium]|nr:WYL domain-containing protein [Muribaculaceae bacterium]
MTRDLFSRYVWIVDTLMRNEKLSREDFNRLWEKSSISDGKPLAERTFYHYRRSIEQNFHIDILCTRRGEYYIDPKSLSRNKTLTNWMLDSYAVNGALAETPVGDDRVEVEDVPSAREYLPTVLLAMQKECKLIFTYAGFSHSRPERDIVFAPYFLKRYKQRWYMLGQKEKGGDIRTYSLDRIRRMAVTDIRFRMPKDEKAEKYFGHILGVTTSKAPTKRVVLRVTPQQAKYFRALPLHSTQTEEELHDDYSIFTYELKLNYELVHEILSFGDSVKVMDPPELRVMVVEALRDALGQYSF